MGRMATSILVFSLLVPLVSPDEPASGTSDGVVCLMNLKVTFTSAITTATQGMGSMSFQSQPGLLVPTCGGTKVLATATITAGSSTGLISCEAIMTEGSGTFTYDAATGIGFDATFAGNAAGLAMLMMSGITVVGAGVFALAGTDAINGDCITGVSSITMRGAVVFANVVV